MDVIVMTQKEIKRILRAPPCTRKALTVTFIKRLATFLFGGSLFILLLCAIRLFFRVMNRGSVDWLSEFRFFGGMPLGEWCTIYAKGDVLRPIFVAMGLIHGSFSQIVTVRGKRLYGVHLQNAMQEVFPFLGWSYVSYALLILMGVYASGMGYSLTALICLAGTLLGFIAPWIVTAYLTFGRHRQQAVVEYYLCCHKYPKQNGELARDSTLAHILTSALYINEYYKSTRAVPVNVALRSWQGFTVMMTGPNLLPADSKSGSKKLDVTLGRIRGTAQIIIGARTFWQYALQDVPERERGPLVRHILTTAVEDYSVLPEGADQFFSSQRRHEMIPENYAQMLLPWSGFISYLREEKDEYPTSHDYWDSWIQCFQHLYLISSAPPSARLSYGTEDVSNIEKCDFSVRMLFLLMLTVLLGELSALEPHELDALEDNPAGKSKELWIMIERLARVLHASVSWVPRFFPWGLSIIFSYSADWFGSTEGILSLYNTYQWLSCILDAVDSTGDNQEVT